MTKEKSHIFQSTWTDMQDTPGIYLCAPGSNSVWAGFRYEGEAQTAAMVLPGFRLHVVHPLPGSPPPTERMASLTDHQVATASEFVADFFTLLAAKDRKKKPPIMQYENGGIGWDGLVDWVWETGLTLEKAIVDVCGPGRVHFSRWYDILGYTTKAYYKKLYKSLMGKHGSHDNPNMTIDFMKIIHKAWVEDGNRSMLD